MKLIAIAALLFAGFEMLGSQAEKASTLAGPEAKGVKVCFRTLLSVDGLTTLRNQLWSLIYSCCVSGKAC